jgi:acetolactate synthase-1/2/3 large subunit
MDTFSEFGSYEVSESLSDSVPIKPQRLIHELSSTLPRDVVVACDAGENRIFMSHHYRVGSAGGLIQPGSVAGMGYGIPAALGVKLAEPHRRVVAVCGDGGFAMTMNGLLTAIEENLPITVIVMNNSALGWIRNKQGDRPIASAFNSFDYAAIARGMGCRAWRVTEPGELADALAEALAPSDVPFVIDVVTDPSESFEKVRSTLLRQGAEARMLGLETVE